jgi:hypothetical protein
MRFVLAILFVGTCSVPAFALPPIPGYLKQVLEGDAAAKAVAEKVAALESKCDVCHIPKADKKAKGHGLNDLGKANHKHLDDKAFMAAHKDKKTDDALKLFKESWEKTMADKNAAGEIFGDLVKAGKLPFKND